MIEQLKKTLYAGLGATLVTAEKVESALQDLVEKGKLSSEDARAAAQKVADESKREFEEAREGMDGLFNEWMDRAPIVRKKDFLALEKRVTALEEAAQLGSGEEPKTDA